MSIRSVANNIRCSVCDEEVTPHNRLTRLSLTRQELRVVIEQLRASHPGWTPNVPVCESCVRSTVQTSRSSRTLLRSGIRQRSNSWQFAGA
jgi:hypothetical protein